MRTIYTLIAAMLFVFTIGCDNGNIFEFNGQLDSTSCFKEDRLALNFEVDLDSDNPIPGWDDCQVVERENLTALVCTRGPLGEDEELSCYWNDDDVNACEMVIYDRSEGTHCVTRWVESD